MALTAESSVVLNKTKELCAALADDPEFLVLYGQVERFLEDDQARQQYQNVHHQGDALHQKQQAGVKLSDKEIADFDAARDALMKNEVAKDFLDAQRELQSVQALISRWVGMTLELGRMPSEEDMVQSEGGCCGGSGGGSGCCG
jgi:cell fate (sporulation/competence/biofilm development) regulator YlbF (YheA/YmcA/DUF963 family)